MKLRVAAVFAHTTMPYTPFAKCGQYIRRRFHQHLDLWTFLIGVTICGLIFGAITAGQLGDTDRLVLGNALSNLFVAIQKHDLATGSVLWSQRLIGDAQVLALLWLFGVSVIGIPFVVVTVFLRAFSVGFAVGYTTLQFGWKGFLLSSVGIFVHQLITLFTLFIAAATAIRFSLQILQHKLPMTRLTLRFLQYTGTFLLCGGGLMLGAFIQSFVIPYLLTTLLM